MARTRKLHYKLIKDAAADHVGHPGDIWYDPTTTALRFYNGDQGGEVLNAGGTAVYLDYGSLPTNQNRAIDLTYKYHWIVNLQSDSYHYTLANGVEGQELVFFAAVGLRPQDGSCDLFVDNAKAWNDAGPSSSWGAGPRAFRLFYNGDVNNTQSMFKAVFLNGCWSFDGNQMDQGPF